MSTRAVRPGARTLLALLGACVLSWSAQARDCRIAFDMGSSGIRAGSTLAANAAKPTRRNLDLLSPLWAGQGLRSQLPALQAALLELPAQAGWPGRCDRIGAGFSAWRLAWQLEPAGVVDVLSRLRVSTGVAVFVLPAAVEGQLGYRSAQQVLGSALQTSHVVDIGGGSLQVAGERSSFVADLGQKAWLLKLCLQLDRQARTACNLQPMSAAALTQARALALDQFKDLAAQLGAGASLTAITRPVTRGVLPALRTLGQRREGAIELLALSAAIDQLARLDLPALSRQTGSAPAFAGYLLSDMLLLEALMQAAQVGELKVAEADINNLPGLLADQHLLAWSRQHDCYLQRLKEGGLVAYLSDPASCPAR